MSRPNTSQETDSAEKKRGSDLGQSLARIAIWVVLIYSLVALLVAFVNREQSQNIFTIQRSIQYASALQNATNCVMRDSMCLPLSAFCRNVAEQLPLNAKVFMTDMAGEENGGKLGYYYFMANYLFPREVAISIGPPKFDGRYYEGLVPTNKTQLVEAGYNFAFNVNKDSQVSATQLAPLPAEQGQRQYSSCENSNAFLAGMLPLVAAGFGIWLLSLLFGFGIEEMGLGEKFACGMALGALVLGQVEFGTKLAGVNCGQLLFWLLLAGLVALAIKNREPIKLSVAREAGKWITPASLLLVPHVVFLVVLLWLAGVQGLVEFDAVAGWTLKAKIIHLCRGHEIIKWFSDPNLAHAHLDYPVLVPSLHALTYDVIGGVDEFVTKLWPTWMLVALVAGVCSVCGFPKRNKLLIPCLTLAFLSMPITTQFLRTEGATGPALLFTALGSIECGLAVSRLEKKRLWLGFLMLLGGAMTKFEGAVVLAFWMLAVFCHGKTRQLLIPKKREWIISTLAVVIIIPYGVMRVQVPQLHPDQLALRNIVKHPFQIASASPAVMGILTARQCVDEDFATWTMSKETGIEWSGKWHGFQSLVDKFNLGWAWLCLILGGLLIARRTTRSAAIMLVLGAAFFLLFVAAVYCGIPYLFGETQRIIDATTSTTGGRHVAPVLFASGLGLIALLLSARAEVESGQPSNKASSPALPKSSRKRDRS